MITTEELKEMEETQKTNLESIERALTEQRRILDNLMEQRLITIGSIKTLQHLSIEPSDK